MQDFMKTFSFKSLHIDDTPPFHHNNQVSESQIDHILCFIPEKAKLSITFEDILCQKINSSNLWSHDPVIGKILLPKPSDNHENEPNYTNTYTDFCVKKPKWNESGMSGYQFQSAQVISDIMDRFNQPEHIPALSEMCSKMLVLCAENYFEVTKPKNVKLRSTPNFTPRA